MERREHEQWYFIPDEGGNNDIYTTSGRRIGRAVSMQDAEQIINDHNQHTTLVEQRDLLAGVLAKVRTWLVSPATDAITILEMREIVSDALATVEQGHEELAGSGSEG